MLVERLLPTAHERLVTIGDGAPLIDVAKLLRAGTDLVVVQDVAGYLAGVITKSDVVSRISQCQGANCLTAVSLVMTRQVVLCRPKDALNDVWSTMKTRGLKNVPIIDHQSRAIGLLNARDALQTLLQEVEDEELMLREYVMGIGYH